MVMPDKQEKIEIRAAENSEDEEWESVADEEELKGFPVPSDDSADENAEPEARQRRERERRLPRRFDDFVVGVARAVDNEPGNYTGAMNGSNKKEWLQAMND